MNVLTSILKYIPGILAAGYGIFQFLRTLKLKKEVNKAQDEAARLKQENDTLLKEKDSQQAAAEAVSVSKQTNPAETARQLETIRSSARQTESVEEITKKDGSADYMAYHSRIRKSLYKERYGNDKK